MRIAHSILPFFLFTKKSCKILCNFPEMFQFKYDTIIPNFVKCFRDIKKNTSNLITAVKRFVNIMSYRQKLLIYIWIWQSSFPTKFMNCPSNKNDISLSVMPNFTFLRWEIIYFELKFCKYNLVVAICVKRRMDTWIYNHIELRSKNQIYTWS